MAVVVGRPVKVREFDADGVELENDEELYNLRQEITVTDAGAERGVDFANKLKQAGSEVTTKATLATALDVTEAALGSVDLSAYTFSDPPTQAECNALRNAVQSTFNTFGTLINELRTNVVALDSL